ncbi:hypothetical protein SFRURICE_020707 [Spodoptera frugiperda]|uniref:SFRICE_005390 n=1 Tax=Spodoptera frugiperda TaxID=7108 RepID=A0A2H1V6A0_SPOFR|nr:uncharacterized protein LOC118274236 [Spodoptera frugiperda]KAF9814529.1 hypothetical protein SFRURICE_020707 [Spodoptera frugiperda]
MNNINKYLTRIFLIVYIILMLVFGYWASDAYRQERAKLKYANPKYIKDPVVFTGRRNRNSPYQTNMSCTILVPFGNNVSFATTFTMVSGGDFRLVTKACDCSKSKWIHDFMQSYTNLTLKKCPYPPGRYAYYNIELPPKNIPLPIVQGDYWIKFEFFVTDTKEPIVEVDSLLHYDPTANAKRSKGKKG